MLRKLAVAFDKNNPTPPSTIQTLRKLREACKAYGVDVSLISVYSKPQIEKYDALWLRQPADTGSPALDIALRFAQEGKPVLDDLLSVKQCTDKVYMQALLKASGVSLPRSHFLSARSDLQAIADDLGYPLVLKLPDSDFSRGVFKVDSMRAFKALSKKLLEKRALLLVQEFVATNFDWRIGVLDNTAIFACQYDLVSGHWQILKHHDDGSFEEGSGKVVDIKEAPPEVIRQALKAAGSVGNGLYGVDLKETADRVVVIEVNDNPNIEWDFEASVNPVWQPLCSWFATQLAARE